jgi:RNA polymerase sigma-70 factor, ECF subfamily
LYNRNQSAKTLTVCKKISWFTKIFHKRLFLLYFFAAFIVFTSQMTTPNITQILQKWSEGDENALETLIPLVYQELHRLAHRALARNSSGNTVQTTALVHEAYLRLIDAGEINWQSRTHFYAVSATLMRNILVDFARARLAQKRGGEVQHVELDEALDFSPNKSENLVALDDALKELSKLDERQSRIVELRFFGGLTEQETADVMKISPATVRRDWQMARAWLHRELAY